MCVGANEENGHKPRHRMGFKNKNGGVVIKYCSAIGKVGTQPHPSFTSGPQESGRPAVDPQLLYPPAVQCWASAYRL